MCLFVTTRVRSVQPPHLAQLNWSFRWKKHQKSRIQFRVATNCCCDHWLSRLTDQVWLVWSERFWLQEFPSNWFSYRHPTSTKSVQRHYTWKSPLPRTVGQNQQFYKQLLALGHLETRSSVLIAPISFSFHGQSTTRSAEARLSTAIQSPLVLLGPCFEFGPMLSQLIKF